MQDKDQDQDQWPVKVILTDDQVAAFFRVLWYFERVKALHDSLSPTLYRRLLLKMKLGHGDLQRLLLTSIASAILTWSRYCDTDVFDLKGLGRNDDDKALVVDTGGNKEAGEHSEPRWGSAKAVIDLATILQDKKWLRPAGPSAWWPAGEH